MVIVFNLVFGIYFVMVMDVNGCIVIVFVVVIIFFVLICMVIVDQEFILGDNGVFMVNVVDGIVFYIYSWSNGVIM